MLIDSLLLLLQILLINIVLSGDNAVVIAMASRNLPLDQRKQAIRWGALGAVVLRIILSFVIVLVMRIPYLQAAGSLFLLYISLTLLNEGGDEANVKEASNIVQAIRTILIADFMMSLDNVLAIVGVSKNNYLLLIMGIVISIPLIIWCSTLIMNWLHKFPVLMFVGSGILGYTAGKMFLNDNDVAQYIHLSEAWDRLIPVIAAAAVIVIGMLQKLIHRGERESNRKQYDSNNRLGG